MKEKAQETPFEREKQTKWERREGDRSTSGEKAKRGKGEEKDGKTNGLSRGEYYMRAEN